jgi:hypothetical protein
MRHFFASPKKGVAVQDFRLVAHPHAHVVDPWHEGCDVVRLQLRGELALFCDTSREIGRLGARSQKGSQGSTPSQQVAAEFQCHAKR